MLRLKGLGDAGKNGGATGDLYITFAIKPRAGIVRQGLDLYSEVLILEQAPCQHEYDQCMSRMHCQLLYLRQDHVDKRMPKM